MNNYLTTLQKETDRIEHLGISKRHEHIISGYTTDTPPKAVINGKSYLVFNSNDYLGLRLDHRLIKADHVSTDRFGTGPGAVRFISGTTEVHRDLELALAKFHNREDALVFSSAFAANLAVISSLIKGQSKDSLLDANTLVVSDELNHRSIVEGIRVANLPAENRKVYHHLNIADLEAILSTNTGAFARCLVITDGVFSMLGEIAPLKEISAVITKNAHHFPDGILLLVDDCHGIGVLGSTGRGVEEYSGTTCDVLIGTLGKAFGTDGGYVVGSKIMLDYLRDAAATYIYSNSISPGTAGAALAAVKLMSAKSGQSILAKLNTNIVNFKKFMSQTAVVYAADSIHAIQPLLIGDPLVCRKLQTHLFSHQILATCLSYPVVSKGRDEIRVQINAGHSRENLEYFASIFKKFI